MKKTTASNYKQDKLYPAVARAVAEILKTESFVTPVDVLLHMQRITKQQVEDWRFGRIPYLERVTVGGLGKMYRILRILELHARSLNLKPSQTVYRKWGKGGKRIVLRFSKSGDHNLEAAYSRHYLAKSQRPMDATRLEQSTEFSNGKESIITKTKRIMPKTKKKTKATRWTDQLDRGLVCAALEDACVDAYDEYEQHTGLLTMIENDLRFPFRAHVLGEQVNVVDMEWPENNQFGLDLVCERGRITGAGGTFCGTFGPEEILAGYWEGPCQSLWPCPSAASPCGTSAGSWPRRAAAGDSSRCGT